MICLQCLAVHSEFGLNLPNVAFAACHSLEIMKHARSQLSEYLAFEPRGAVVRYDEEGNEREVRKPHVLLNGTLCFHRSSPLSFGDANRAIGCGHRSLAAGWVTKGSVWPALSLGSRGVGLPAGR